MNPATNAVDQQRVAEDPRIIVALQSRVATLEVELATASKELELAKQARLDALNERDEYVAKCTALETRLTATELRERALAKPAVIIPDAPPSAPKPAAPRRRTGPKKDVDE